MLCIDRYKYPMRNILMHLKDWVFWIMVNIMKYDYYCQNAKYTTYGALK